MKTLLFCNLIPLKTGAYEALLAAIGQEFRKSGDEYVVVFSGDPIPEVADSLRAASVRWHVMREWVGGGGELLSCSVDKLLSEGPAGSRPSTTQQLNNLTTVTGEKVHPWGFVLPAVRLICLERPDVVAVHFGNEMPTLAASLLCRLIGWRSRIISLLTTQQLNNSATFHPPRWVWEQDQQIQDPGKISRWASKLRIMGLGVDRYLAVYEGGRQSMLKRGIPVEKITVIHNSVAPYTPLRPKGWLRGELLVNGYSLSVMGNTNNKEPITNKNDHEVILVTNGSLIPRKRIDFILKACALLQKEKSFEQKPAKPAKGEVGDACGEKPHALDFEMHPTAGEAYTPQPPLRSSRASVQNLNFANWRLLVIGEGPERERLAALAAELGIADRVHFLGLRNDVREILPECDIYLHASKAETCTYAVTESMAAGVPAVMLNAGAAKEQIENGVTGFVFDEVDPGLFAACLSDLMVNPVRRSEMGRLAKCRWVERFLVERAAASYCKMYGKLALAS